MSTTNLPPPADYEEWEKVAPNPNHLDAFMQSQYFVALVAHIADQSMAEDAISKLRSWSVDPYKFKQREMASADRLLASTTPFLGTQQHVEFINCVKVRLAPEVGSGSDGDNDDVMSCKSTEDPSQKQSTTTDHVPSGDDATKKSDSAQDAAGASKTQTTDDAQESDDEHSAGAAPDDDGAESEKTKKPLTKPTLKSAAKSNVKHDKGKRESGKPAVGARLSKPKPDAAKNSEPKTFAEVVTGAAKSMSGKSATLVSAADTTKKKHVTAGAPSEVSAEPTEVKSTFRANVESKESIDVPMISIPQDVATAAGMTTLCLPSAMKPSILELVELSASRGCDFAYREDVMTNVGSALLTASNGHMKGKLDRAGTIIVVRSGLKAQYVLLRDIQASPQTTPIDQRVSFLQTHKLLSVDTIAPCPDRAFITGEAQAMANAEVLSINRYSAKKSTVGPTDLIRAVGNGEMVSREKCLVCSHEMLGDKKFCAQRVRIQLKHKTAEGAEVTERDRVAYGLELQQRENVLGVYLAGKDLVAVLNAPVTDNDVSYLKSVHSVFKVWCEVRPLPLQARINKAIPSVSEVTCVSKPDSTDVVVTEMQLVRGRNVPDAVWKAIANQLSIKLIISNFDMAQFHIPINIYQQHNKQFAEEQLYNFQDHTLSVSEMARF